MAASLFPLLLCCSVAACALDLDSNASLCRTNCSAPSTNCQPCSVTCRISDLRDLDTCVRRPSQVLSLNLSKNGLTGIPGKMFQNYTNLLNLSLAHNKIYSIEREAFYGLNALRFLNLEGNDVTSWDEEFALYLPSLTSLDITGSAVVPRRQVLQSLALREIKGVTWNGDCTNCELLRNGNLHGNGFRQDMTVDDLKQGVFVRGLKGDCRADRHSVKNTSVTFAKHGFFPVCVAQNEGCFHSEISITPIHRCWETDNNILNVEFLIGTLGLLLNATVFVTIFSMKSLRTNVSLLLMGNMAISDSMISAYSVAITSARRLPYVKFVPIMNALCRCLGLLWILGQVVTVTTSVLLTLERYLAVIHYAIPSKRMTFRRASEGIVFCWLLALVLAILPLVGIGVYTSNTYCIPIRPRRDIPHMFEFSVGLTLVGIILYFITLPLYFKMYLFVRRSCHQVRVDRESALAKRIAQLVISNMLFFMFPVVVSLLWLASDALQSLPTTSKNILASVVPTVCFSINSIINPLLSACRHDRFKRALRERIQSLSSCCSRCLETEGHESNKENKSPARVPRDTRVLTLEELP